MVNNYTNINKMNNYLSPRSSTKERLEHMALEMNVMTCDKHKKGLS